MNELHVPSYLFIGAYSRLYDCEEMTDARASVGCWCKSGSALYPARSNRERLGLAEAGSAGKIKSECLGS